MKIAKVSEATRPYSTKFGEMISYSIQFEGSEDWIDLSQKQTTSAPKAGDELEGNIEDTQYGKKFKKAYNQSPTNTPKDYTKQNASIERQVALKAATELVIANKDKITGDTTRAVLIIASTLDKWLKEGDVPPKHEERSKPEVKEITDEGDLVNPEDNVNIEDMKPKIYLTKSPTS